LQKPEPERVMRSYLPPPAGTGFDFDGDFSGPPVLNNDGTAVAFSAHSPNERLFIWVQALNELTARRLEGTEGGAFPFWSADGKSLGFFADGHLKRIPAAGGPVTVLAEAPNARGGTWNQDNVIVFEPDYRNSLWQINAASGAPTRLTKIEEQKHTTHRWPQFMPDGKHFIFFATNHSGSTEEGIYFGSLADGSYRRVIDSDAGGQYASGYLLYHLQSQLLALKFNPSNGSVSGDPIPVANFPEYDQGTWHSTFTASQNGLLIYEPGAKDKGVQLVWLDRSGKTVGKVEGDGAYRGAGDLSPDGKKLVVSDGDPQADIWVIDLATNSRTRLTFGGATHLMPSWSVDGKSVVYVRQAGSTVVQGTSICVRPAAGGGQEEVLLNDADAPGTRNEKASGASVPESVTMPQFSPDGRYLLHIEASGPTGSSLWALSLADKKLIPIVKPQTPLARIIQYSLSPDGHWLAFTSTDSGREEVYVTRFPSGEGRWQVSQTAGTFPRWRSDGKEIYFAGLSDGNFRAASVTIKGDEFEVGESRALFSIAFTSPLGTPYQPTRDGQRFLIATYPETVPTPLVVVNNWTAELKK
jgi:eukaryotic-like serine/threonine-protein kinase